MADATAQTGEVATPDGRWFVYVLRCRGDRVYCGIAKDVEARYAEHLAGRGAKFTRAFPPQERLAVIACAGRSEALKAEAAFKALRREAKQRTVAEWRAQGTGTSQFA